MSSRLPAVILSLTLAALPACEDATTGGAILPPLSVSAIGPKTLVPGSRIVVYGTGFTGPEVSDLIVVMRGAVDGEPIEFAVAPERIDDETLAVSVTGQVEGALIRPGGRLVGRLSVLRTPHIDASPEEKGRDFDLRVATSLTPRVASISPELLFVGDVVTLQGEGFLYPSEGASVIELSGTMSTTQPTRVIPVNGLQLPGEQPDTLDAPADSPIAANSVGLRDALTFTLTPDVLGVLPGRFVGQVRVVNTALGGAVTSSDALPVDLPLQAPLIESLQPTAASRGQWIRIQGRGFTAPDGLLQAATVLVLEGIFTPLGGPATALSGPSALVLVPDLQLDNRHISAVLRVERDTDGRLSGLGLLPGRFDGSISPVLLLGPDLVRGEGHPLVFDVLPQRQIVYIRALPAFDDALAEFGLLAEKEAVKARMLEVVTRDYQGINIAFTWDQPADYAEYGVVELAGHDTNGTGLFGLDNTEGKDTGNLRFNDVIGGYNADTSASGYSAYGGVFPSEFMNLSVRRGDNPLASPRFDDVFEGVAPALGGKAAQRGESDGDNDRAQEIREAIRVFGNLVGSTVSHEVGHSLGLAAVDGQFHNIGDNPGWLMDSGSYRPFEERAELDGQGPSFFGPESRAYLQRILPTF
jgi:hypothetical protein